MARKDQAHGSSPPADASARTASEWAGSLSVSRRRFLQTVGVTSIATGVVGPVSTRAQSAPTVLGPEAVPIALLVNGQRRSLEVEPRTTLLDALRNGLDHTGVKRVCDRGSCGACTMILDGRAVYSCSVLAIDAQGRSIRTIEALTAGTALHPVQQAFARTDGLMCGFCTPGFVMAAVALLERVPNPTPEQARRALDGNICRCGTYARVLEAVLTAEGVRRG